MYRFNYITLLGLVSCGWLNAQERVPVFAENFDNTPPYRVQEDLPLGNGIIHYGSWGKVLRANRAGVVEERQSLSPPFSVALRGNDYFEKGARIIGFFGDTNARNSAVTGALSLKLAFRTDGSADNFICAIRNASHHSAALVAMNEEGILQARFASGRKDLGRFEAGKWYYLEFQVPGSLTAASEYSVTLYAEDGSTVLATQKGRLTVADAAAPLVYFTVGHQGHKTLVHIDNITAFEYR